jgi:hypothetical protein
LTTWRGGVRVNPRVPFATSFPVASSFAVDAGIRLQEASRMAGPSPRRRRSTTTILTGAALLGALALTSACSSDQSAVQAAANAPIGIETSQLGVTLENHTGTPLVDLTVAILTPALTFTKDLTRMENAERRQLSLNDFSTRDGTTLNLRFVTPRSVRVTATDIVDKKYDVQTRWR